MVIKKNYDYVYIAHFKFAEIFLNPIYISQTIGTAETIEEAYDFAMNFFKFHKAHNDEEAYSITTLRDEESVVVGWRVVRTIKTDN